MRKLGIILAFLFVLPTAAQAANKLYWGAMVGSTDYDVSQGAQLFMTSLSGRGGWDVFPWLAVEGRVMTTASSSGSGITDLSVRYMGSVYAKFSLAVHRNTRWKLYALSGYSDGQLRYNNGGTQTQHNVSGPSFGVGVEMFADDNNGINFEWLRVINKSNYTISQYALGYIHRF